MLRSVVGGALRMVALAARTNNAAPRLLFSSLSQSCTATAQLLPKPTFAGTLITPTSNLLQPTAAAAAVQQQTLRSVTKFSLRKGKRKSVKAVIKRFKRLDWGGWIRTHSGRHKKMFKKSPALKRRLRQHVLTNATQSWLLDKMVTSFWRRPKHYIDDPYAPYHKRDEYFATKSKTFKV